MMRAWLHDEGPCHVIVSMGIPKIETPTVNISFYDGAETVSFWAAEWEEVARLRNALDYALGLLDEEKK